MGRRVGTNRGVGLSSQQIGQRWALDQLHHQRDRVATSFDAVHLSDVRMVERREDLGFAPEPRHPFRIGRNRCG